MALPAAKISSHKCLTKLQRKGKPSPTLFHTNVSLSSMQQSGHHFQPLPPKQQETNFHPNNISEFQFKSVSSHKGLTNSKLDSSAHTNVALSSNGRESYPHLVSHKCLIKLHAAKRPSLSTSRSKGTGNKFPSKSLECQFKSVSSHKCFTNSKSDSSAHTNVSLSSKGRESHPHLVSRKCLTKLHAAKRPSLSTSRSKGTGNKFPSKSLECQFKSVSSHKCLTNSKLDSSAHTNVALSSKGRESHPHLVSRKCLTKSLSSMQRNGHHHIEAQDRRDGKQSSDSQTHP